MRNWMARAGLAVLATLGAGLAAGRGSSDLELENNPLIYVMVELREDARATVRGFTESMRASKLVVSAHYVTGEADVVLTLRVSGVPEYARFVEQRLTGDAGVRRFRTLTSIRQLL